MSDLSSTFLILITEGFFVLLVIILFWLFTNSKNKKIDQQSARKLIKQIKHQSKTRLEKTGSFLNEKYRFEGDELKKAVLLLDKSEKKFYTKIIHMYLKRDAKSLVSLDSSVAELIDSYKSLSPVMPDTDAILSESTEELEKLREANASLSEKLITNEETMNNMVKEFGNMFAGGDENELAKHEILEKLPESNSLE